MRLSLETRKYMLWADCSAHGWDRSYKDMIETLSRTHKNAEWTVHIIDNVMKNSGWQGRNKDSGAKKRAGTISAMKNGYRFDDNDLDLVDLFTL